MRNHQPEISGRLAQKLAPPCLLKSEQGVVLPSARVSVYPDHWRCSLFCYGFRDEFIGRRCPSFFSLRHNIGSRHQYFVPKTGAEFYISTCTGSPYHFQSDLTAAPVHIKLTNRLLPPYWKTGSLYGGLYYADRIPICQTMIEVTPCVSSQWCPSGSYVVGGIGARLRLWRGRIKSFTFMCISGAVFVVCLQAFSIEYTAT